MLARYLSAVINNSAQCIMISDNNGHDPLSEVITRTRTWQFRDGVILMCTEEIETAVYDGDSQCPEQWIVWELIEFSNESISPQRKEFFSICQQNFWLKMQAGCE
ncbi:hypothetical protein AYY17_01660 [Morganella psychrotolerans]|uniref:Uncharacterized protein n=2 Tax=Morganella psychrotolerans TaxID=368603 RepID=A0A1B8HPY2_9GAMM|nr:hypothetical protein AYY17_01660 [Morganella psychrotolerans]